MQTSQWQLQHRTSTSAAKLIKRTQNQSKKAELLVHSKKAQEREKEKDGLKGLSYVKPNESLLFTWIPETEARNSFSYQKFTTGLNG